MSLMKLTIFSLVWVALFSLFLIPKYAAAENYPEFPFSKKMSVVVIANDMQVNGLPMRAYQFKTNEDENHIVDFYVKEWGDEMTNVLFGDWRILSHKENGYLMTVQIEQNSSSITHGTLGITPMFDYIKGDGRKMKRALKAVGKNIPILPGSKVVIDTESKEQGKTIRTVLFSNNKSIDRNLSFYINYLEREGWSMLSPDMFEKTKKAVPAIAMNRNGEKFNLSFVRHSGETYGIAMTER